MALWGSSDNIVSAGIVTLALTGGDWIVSGEEHEAQFGQTAVGGAKTGDVIRFGYRGEGGTYFGDAVIVSIASSTRLTIGSTSGIENAAGIAGTDYYVSELPVSSVIDSKYSEREGDSPGTEDAIVVGVGTTNISTQYKPAHTGWVGVHTYTDMHGNLRVKSEVLVAAGKDLNGSGGISTGGNGIAYPTPVNG